jgi:hypothetical protein
MPRVGFEPTIPLFERVKTVHVLDCAATVMGYFRKKNGLHKLQEINQKRYSPFRENPGFVFCIHLNSHYF